ncbi:TPA: hypothetical protein QDB26_005336 [Burkholderia vietnamiensis]|nr:hypothetical protein [Burkholderia vietnamiensis]HDR9216546.1 hypothetical protein [Burkholderia vietnamiensis]
MVSIEHAARAIARAIAADSPDRQPVIAQKWHRELMASFLNGNLRVLDSSDMAPIHPERPGAVASAVIVGVVTRDELNRWLTAQGTPVTIDQMHIAQATTSGSAGSASDGPNPDLHWCRDPYWKKIGREHANQIARRNMERGYGGTSHRDIEVAVTAALVREPGFPNPTVKPGRIRKVILNGWTWDGVIVAPTARTG